jgi:hypothetical protein
MRTRGFPAGLAALAAASALGAEPAPVQFSVRADKILFGTDERITGRVLVTNRSDQALRVDVTAHLEWEIDAAGPEETETLELAPRAGGVAEFRLGKPAARYGHAFVAEVATNGAPFGAGQDFFNVCDDYWNVALIAAMSLIWQQFDSFKPRPDFAWADSTVATWRRDYFNGFEKFFWAPDDFLELTPDRDIWWSGQARYLETKVGLQTLIERAHEQGLKAITYAKLTGCGPTGVEMARRHPEWVWQSGGTLSVDRNARQIAIWDITSTNHWSGWVAVNYNMNDPKVVDIGIQELIASADLFGWDGARWDGNFDVAKEVYDLEGKRVETLTSEQVDARNTENMRRTKERIRRKLPRYVFGYNWTQGNWAQSLATNPKESTELCRGGGLIMNEYINQAEGVQHPLHRWDVFGPSVAADVEAIKKLGGYYGPILGSPDTADGRYQNVFAYAAGAHPYYHHHWGAFMTRFGAYCWDTALERVPPEKAPEVVQGPDAAWWKHWVFWRPVDAVHRQLIVHLINPPAKPTVGEGKKKEDLPAPLENLSVRVPVATLGGWKVDRATRLSPEPWLCETLETVIGPEAVEVRVPDLAIWNIVVLDLEP